MVRPALKGPVARYFYDCEFIEDGREFYAVSTEFDPGRANPWVRKHVLDKLPSPGDRSWRSRSAIRDELYDFLSAPRLPIELWAWFAAYDHVVLAQLWGAMPDLPRDVPRLTREVRQHWEAAGSPPIPGAGKDRHDALADARLAYARWQVAQEVLAARGHSRGNPA